MGVITLHYACTHIFNSTVYGQQTIFDPDRIAGCQVPENTSGNGENTSTVDIIDYAMLSGIVTYSTQKETLFLYTVR